MVSKPLAHFAAEVEYAIQQPMKFATSQCRHVSTPHYRSASAQRRAAHLALREGGDKADLDQQADDRLSSGQHGHRIVNTPQGLLQSVSADSATDVWAVGAYGASTLIMHYDGTSWSVVPVPAVFKPQTPDLFGVAARAANDVWAVGSEYTQQGQRPIILHWNGTAWSQATVSGPGVVTNVLNGVAAVGPATVWAVGYYGDAYGTNSTQALIEHYTG
jgi:hypothetical protein